MLDSKELSENWFIQSSDKLDYSGRIISQKNFQVEGWIQVSVPTTVVAGLVENKVYPDPFEGLNLKKIPGFKVGVHQNFDNYPKPDNSPFICSWWFRKEINLDRLEQTKNIWLLFKGINFKANIWINGKLLADSTEIIGTFRQFDLNITPYVEDGINVIALEIFSPGPKDLSISFVDWNPVPPDDNMGLWQPVLYYQTGNVKLQNTIIDSKIDDLDKKTAIVDIKSELINLVNKSTTVIIKVSIDDIIIEKNFILQPNELLHCNLNWNEFPQLKFKNPKLWWPYQLGEPFLYSAHISISVDGTISDKETIQFGMREIKSNLYQDQSRLFRINGINLLIRGVAWTPDMMLRQSKDRDDKDIVLIKNLHVNTIRMEGKLATDYFWHKCDKEGILVIAGWVCCGFWEQWDDWNADDLEIAKESLSSQLFRLHNHPSLICWLYGSDFPPPEHVEREYLQICHTIYPTLPVLSSASDHPSVLAEDTGIKMTGPYTYVPPIYWYLDRKGSAERFNAEAGPDVCIPPWESILKMIPKDQRFIGSDVWNFHLGLGAFSDSDKIEESLEFRYGKPKNLQDFVKTSQLLGYECWRSVFEAYARNFPIASGFIGWKGNSAWSSLIWQLFDVYYNTNGAYYGVQKACEPLHIQYSYDDDSIWIINYTLEDQQRLEVNIRVLDIQCNEIYTKKHMISIQRQYKTKIDVIPKFKSVKDVYFLLLEIKNAKNLVSRNFYWLTLTKDKLAETDGWPTTAVIEHANMKTLRLLPIARINTTYKIFRVTDQMKIKVYLQNRSNIIALFLRVFIINNISEDVVLPVLWDENCISLLPMETYELNGTIMESKNEHIKVLIDGWNTEIIDNIN